MCWYFKQGSNIIRYRIWLHACNIYTVELCRYIAGWNKFSASFHHILYQYQLLFIVIFCLIIIFFILKFSLYDVYRDDYVNTVFRQCTIYAYVCNKIYICLPLFCKEYKLVNWMKIIRGTVLYNVSPFVIGSMPLAMNPLPD